MEKAENSADYLDTRIPRIDSIDHSSNSKGIGVGTQSHAVKENVRNSSGMDVPRWDLPINISQTCLSHQCNGKDTQLTLRLFKLACLAYKPSHVNYRGMIVDRKTMIRIRRGLVDKIT